MTGPGNCLDWSPQKRLDDNPPVRGQKLRLVALELRALRADLEVLGWDIPTVKRCALSHLEAVERLVL